MKDVFDFMRRLLINNLPRSCHMEDFTAKYDPLVRGYEITLTVFAYAKLHTVKVYIQDVLLPDDNVKFVYSKEAADEERQRYNRGYENVRDLAEHMLYLLNKKLLGVLNHVP